MYTHGGELTEDGEGHEEHVEQSQRCEYGCGVERMIGSISYEGDDAGEDGKRYAYGYDRCPEDSNGTDIPSRTISSRFSKAVSRDTYPISDSRT